MEHWTRCVDDGNSIDVVYLDFLKAFDKVPHRRLLAKLEAYGISGKVLYWINAFLSNRRQRVVVRGAHSEWSSVTSIRGHSFSQRIINDWNTLPFEIVSAPNVLIFKTKLDLFLYDRRFDFLQS